MKLSAFVVPYICFIAIVPSCSAQFNFIEMLLVALIPGLKHSLNIDDSRPIEDVCRFFNYLPTSNRTEVFLNDPAILTKIDFSKPINMLIHGWRDSSVKLPWMNETAYAWTINTLENVIVVDWSSISFNDYILTSTVNIKVAAYYISVFINFLVTNGCNLKNMHIAGHSLGAHIAGDVGARLGGGIGRITGLDPAGPLFTVPNIVPHWFRLDKSDGGFVQIIHTCGLLLGVAIDSGHADYYPNLENFPQPGCSLPDIGNTISPPSNGVLCSHYKSIEYFRASMDKKVQCRGVKCIGVLAYLFHICGGVRDIIGPYSQRIWGKFYFFASAQTPLCTGRDYY